jgi:hypothetical protein
MPSVGLALTAGPNLQDIHTFLSDCAQKLTAPHKKDKLVCKTHGGRSTGPKTKAGRQRCAEAKPSMDSRLVRREPNAVLHRHGWQCGDLKVAELVNLNLELGFLSCGLTSTSLVNQASQFKSIKSSHL